jgi:uncharacterized protein
MSHRANLGRVSEQTGTLVVRDNPEHRRYEAYVGEELAGFSQYRVQPGVITFTHTKVDPDFEGRGVGSQLVRTELDEARARGLKVVPMCPFVRAYIARHAEYADLVVPGPEPGARR